MVACLASAQPSYAVFTSLLFLVSQSFCRMICPSEKESGTCGPDQLISALYYVRLPEEKRERKKEIHSTRQFRVMFLFTQFLMRRKLRVRQEPTR